MHLPSGGRRGAPGAVQPQHHGALEKSGHLQDFELTLTSHRPGSEGRRGRESQEIRHSVGDGPEAGGLAGVKEKASQGVMVRADITGTACTGKTLEESHFNLQNELRGMQGGYITSIHLIYD